MTDKAVATKKAPEAKVDPNEINVKAACEILGVKEMRVKTIARKGEFPSDVCWKNEKGWWRFNAPKLTAWAKDRPARKGGTRDGRITYKLRLNDQEASLVRGALKGTGLELVRLNPPKKKATEPSPAK